MENNYFDLKILEEILNIPSPTGYTKNILNYLKKVLNNMNIDYKISNKGLLLVTIEGKDLNKSITFSSHIDTLGAVVANIKSNGHLSINQIGGYIMNQ